MRLVAWIRASQAVLFEASVVPGCVGTAAAVGAGAPFEPLYFALILVSLVSIQAGANLLKGYYEAQERSVPPSSAGSWLAFDSGAAVGLAREPRNVLRVAWAFMVLGIASGLTLVALTRSLLLLAFGVAGFLLAWSYSSPPLRLSYRGIGELSTFLAFGPIMTVGATVAFGTVGVGESFVSSLVLGFLAAAISFSRYFPNAPEDRAKGKRTPVTIQGVDSASLLLLWLWLGAIFVILLWFSRAQTVAVLLPIPFIILAYLAMNVALDGRRPFALPIGLTILAHVLAGVGLVLALLS